MRALAADDAKEVALMLLLIVAAAAAAEEVVEVPADAVLVRKAPLTSPPPVAAEVVGEVDDPKRP